jgi:thioredoxin-related protein
MNTSKDILKALFLFFSFFVLCYFVGFSSEIKETPVNFIEYNKQVIQKYKNSGKPFYLLFSADWCIWCKRFEKRTLLHPSVYSYLNQYFINIFIAVDVNAELYKSYQAVGTPYTVFLNPDGSLFYKYSGALWSEDFLNLLKEVKQRIDQGKAMPSFDLEL